MNPDTVNTAGFSLETDASLATHNTLRVAARARRLAQVRDALALPDLLSRPEVAASCVLVLGEGSNVLFTNDYDGTVAIMATRGVEVTAETDTHTHLRVAAGERWDDFVRWSLGQGYPGLENMIMIPGTVGAAPMQNIGAYGVEVAGFVESVEALDRETMQWVKVPRDACEFSYRDSRFKRAPDRHIIAAVNFALPRQHHIQADYAGLREQLARMGAEHPAAFHVAEAVVQLRTRKLPDPALIGNAGSFFKNPLLPEAQAQTLRDANPELPLWPAADGHAKVSAAWLIETCGFKGLRDGDAGISNRHALVLVNHGDASGAQLWTLAQRVRDGVEARFGVRLQAEPRII